MPGSPDGGVPAGILILLENTLGIAGKSMIMTSGGFGVNQPSAVIHRKGMKMKITWARNTLLKIFFLVSSETKGFISGSCEPVDDVSGIMFYLIAFGLSYQRNVFIS